ALRGNAVIQSTESSNRIEGVVAPPQRIRDLVAKRTEPANRSEQEIAGYRDVLNTIHTNFAGMQLTSNLVLQLHRDLFQFVPAGGGRWKSADHDIIETRADGTTAVRFKPLAPHLVPDAMTQLHERYRAALDATAVDRRPDRFRYADVERALPAVSRPTIARVLRELRLEGAVRCVKPGREATWEKTPA